MNRWSSPPVVDLRGTKGQWIGLRRDDGLPRIAWANLTKLQNLVVRVRCLSSVFLVLKFLRLVCGQWL